MSITKDEIKEAFIEAMSDPSVSRLFTGRRSSSPGDTTSTSGSDDTVPDVDFSSSSDERDDERESESEKNKKFIKSVSANATAVFGASFKAVGEMGKIALNALGSYNKELDDEVLYFRQVQKTFGGITEAAYASGEALSGVSGQALEAAQHLGLVSANGKDSALEIESGALKGKNALIELFKDPVEAANLFKDVLVDVSAENVSLSMSLKELGEEEAERIAILSKRMNIESNTMGNILRRQYAFSGEASAQIIEDVAAAAVSVGKATGAAAETLQANILDIMQDTEKFGDIGVDSAARIAGALNQLGLDFQTFQNMTNQFMNFDSAAQKMGDLSALFGIQMDAMEMTYLANEDQEEFLFRMREEILDAGLDVENMSKTRQRALAGQLNMNVEQMRQFMRDGELQVDQMGLEAATTEAETMDGMATAIENFGGAYEGAYRGAHEFEKSLRMQATFSDEVARNIIRTREAAGELPGKAIGQFRLSQAALDNAIISLQKTEKVVNSIGSQTITQLGQLANLAGELGAEGVNVGLSYAGIEKDEFVGPPAPKNPEPVKPTNTVITEQVETKANESQEKVAESSANTEEELKTLNKNLMGGAFSINLQPTTNVTIDAKGLVKTGIYQIETDEGIVYATTSKT